jgi:hypothetical protein
MAETMGRLEDEIRNSLSEEGKNETLGGGFKISIKGNGHVEIIELPSLNLKQLELPLTQPSSRKENDYEITTTDRRIGKAKTIQVGPKN